MQSDSVQSVPRSLGPETVGSQEGPVLADLLGFLTSAPNAEVAALHPRAMPVIQSKSVKCEPAAPSGAKYGSAPGGQAASPSG